MKFLFSETGMKILQALTFTKTLYAFDFDGTLSAIVKTPDDAKMTESTTSLMASLSKVAPVAIVSGRSLSDLKGRVSTVSGYLVGNHGLEGLPFHGQPSEKVAEICSLWKNQLRLCWKKLDLDKGVFVEDKKFSLALHYRKSRNKKIARAELRAAIETLEPLPRVILGKCVMNLLPQGAPHKGVALLELMDHLGMKRVFYVGDDDTDEDVFSLPDERVVSVRIGQKKTSHAHYFVRRQSEIQTVLRRILRYLQVGTKSNGRSHQPSL